MKKKTKILVAGAIAALLVVIASWMLASAFGRTGTDLWILRAGLSVLLLGAVTVVTRYLLQKAEAEGGDEAATGPDDISLAMTAARERLASAKIAGGGTIGSLPLITVLGPPGAAKTTTVVRSGLEPEMLAGEGAGGDLMPPTQAVNVWYAMGTIFVEAGGPVATDQARWASVVRHLHPQRLTAAFAGRAQAPRAAVVCFSCEELTRPGSAEAVPAMARTLRTRLAELSEGLGIRLPVYVVFTKVDRIPHFADYVQNFSREEVQQVLGATLTADLDAPAGSYMEREGRRIGDAFHNIVTSLSDKRLMVLGREHAAERRPGAYEFPREMRKIVPLASQFLLELCKPSQLHSSPFLRGFYFTGVQAVIVSDVAPAAAPAAQRGPSSINATSVFQPRAAAPAAARLAPAPVSRKVPRWVFLDRLFRDVVLADRAALTVTGGGARVNLLRRAALASIAAAALLLALVLTVSFAGNRKLARRTADAARAVAALPATTSDVPAIDALQRLDTLRAQVDTLGMYERDGTPVGLGWGLYSGSRYYPAAKDAYFKGFERLMFGATRSSLVGSLRSLPDAARPTDDYGVSYNLLKAYLITTSHPANSTPEFLSPVLMTQWVGGRQVDSARLELAKRQFDFYSSELRSANPYPGEPDAGAVTRGRAFLSTFTGLDRIYQTMVTSASSANTPVRFNARYPGAAPAVFDRYEVPGAFTKSGWTYVNGSLRDVGQLFQGETWVLGPQTGPAVDTGKVATELRTRYVADYVRHWRSYLDSASVGRFSGAREAATRLGVLSGPQSPLLSLFALATEHTTVDSVNIAPAFKAVHIVTPPGKTDMLIGGANAPYFNALIDLQTKVEQVANAAPGTAEPLLPPVMTSAAGAKAATRQLAGTFGSERVGAVVQRLMEAPITNVELALRNVGPGAPELNAKGQSLCTLYNDLKPKFPFEAGAPGQASFNELAAVFQPQSGALWQLYSTALQRHVRQEGTRYVQIPGSSVQINPAFLNFFNNAVAISRAFYGEAGSQPRIAFTFRPNLNQTITAVTLTLDGQATTFTRQSPEARSFVWAGPSAVEAKLAAKVGNNDVTIASYTGPWALFSVFHQMHEWRTTGGLHIISWGVAGRQSTLPDGTPLRLVAEVNFGSSFPVMRESIYSPIDCVTDVAR